MIFNEEPPTLDGLPVAVRQRVASRPLTDGSRPARPGRQTVRPVTLTDGAEPYSCSGCVNTQLPNF